MKKYILFVFFLILSNPSYSFIGALSGKISSLLSRVVEDYIPPQFAIIFEIIGIIFLVILVLGGFLFFLYFAYVSMKGALNKNEKFLTRLADFIRLFVCLGIVVIFQYIIVWGFKTFFS